MTAWYIEARKYDQRLHYRMPVRLIDDDGERLWFYAPPGTLIDHFTRGEKHVTQRASDMFFWRDRWYNVFVNRTPDGALRQFYCNASLPPVISNATLSFVDLDLDVEVYPDGNFRVLDGDEFRVNSVQLGYPPDVSRAACKAVLDIVGLLRARRPPFDLLEDGGV
jgi:protein associated with RNAse G/E